jgi:PHP family Zn ribbon phosphoesterase
MQITEKINQSAIASFQLQIAILASAIERRYRRIDFLIFLPAIECIVSLLENLGTTIKNMPKLTP